MLADPEKRDRTLTEMKALGLPRAKAVDLCEVKEGMDPPPWFPHVLDDYLKHFAVPDKDGKCLRCDTPQAGFMGAMFGGFKWGLAHGEGFCETCKWPGRAYHFVKDEKGEQVLRLNMVLQYHPDELTSPNAD